MSCCGRFPTETADALQAPVLADKGAVEMAQADRTPVPSANAGACPIWHSSGSPSLGWAARRRGWIIGGAAAVAGMGVALGAGWITVGALAPLLYSAPCAIMMLFCMKGMMGQRQQTQNQAAPPPPAIADATRPIPELEKQA